MPIAHHDDIELMPGDDWTIPFALTNADGSPMDLTDASLAWTLIDPTGAECVQIVDAATLNIVAPTNQGNGNIVVPRSATTGLPCGRYFDQMRVTDANQATTVFIGALLIDADAFSI